MSSNVYKGGKRRHHFTLSLPAYEHLCRIAGIAKLSRSEALERLLRASSPHDAHIISDDIWPEILDHTDDQP